MELDPAPGDGRRPRRRRVRARRVVAAIGAVVGLLLLAATWVTVQDVRYNGAIRVRRSSTENATDTGEVRALKRAAAGGAVRAGDLAAAAAFVRGENDGTDFRLVSLLRLRIAYAGQLDPAAIDTLRSLFLGVRYWMTEPGTTPMAYWTENHQVLFATDEYLAGQLLPTDRFRDGRTGQEHRAAARDRLEFWLDQRRRYGFSEWNSHYYAEDVAALSDLIDLATDPPLRTKATMVLDLLLLDMASHTFHGEFIATSGRLYAANRTTGDEAIRRIVRHAFLGTDETRTCDGIDIGFQLSGYRTPPVLAAIANDRGTAVVTRTAGRNVGDLDADRSLTTDERRIMALWGMEAITNPEAINTSFDWIRAHGLLANPYLASFRQLDYRVLRFTHTLSVISSTLDLPTNGTALQRADIYGYRTLDYAMSTTQAYHPGGFGNQEAIFQLTLGPGVSLFHNHPAVRPGEPSPNGNSPSYWTGDGYLPVSCQDAGVNVSLYDLPDEPGYGRSAVLDLTHLRVPFAAFDEVTFEANRVFLRRGTALVAVTAATTPRRVGADELVQDGRRTWWVVEASSTRDETLAGFEARVRTARIAFDGRTLSYASGRRTLAASFAKGCTVDGAPAGGPYGRVPAPYGGVSGGGDQVRVVHGGHSLVLDFANTARLVDGR